MQRYMLKSKIHRATVTGADLNYEGSLGIDIELLEKADILPNEKIDVYNITNGVRFSTYAIAAPRRSREIVLNGAAARCAEIGDRIIIVSFCVVDDVEAVDFEPTLVMLGERNKSKDESRPRYIRHIGRG